LRDVLAAVGPQTVAALCAVGVGLAVQHAFLAELASLPRLALSALICLGTYLVVAVGVLRVTGPIQLALSMLRDFGSLRSPRTP
jgi:PST family polysaccharide transporter